MIGSMRRCSIRVATRGRCLRVGDGSPSDDPVCVAGVRATRDRIQECGSSGASSSGSWCPPAKAESVDGLTSYRGFSALMNRDPFRRTTAPVLPRGPRRIGELELRIPSRLSRVISKRSHKSIHLRLALYRISPLPHGGPARTGKQGQPFGGRKWISTKKPPRRIRAGLVGLPQRKLN